MPSSDIGLVAQAIASIVELIKDFIDPKKQIARLGVKRRKMDAKAIQAAEEYIDLTEELETGIDYDEKLLKQRAKALKKFKDSN